jgi:hypothetical protein
VTVAAANCTLHIPEAAGPPKTKAQQPALGCDDLLFVADRLASRARMLLLPQQQLEGSTEGGAGDAGDGELDGRAGRR